MQQRLCLQERQGGAHHCQLVADVGMGWCTGTQKAAVQF